MVTLNEFFLLVNAIACAISATTLGTFQRPKGAKHNIVGGLLALVLIIACGSVTILILTGQYTTAHPAETVINVVLCIFVVSARGNVMRVFKSAAPVTGDTRNDGNS
ncbi:phage holin family protein [Lelliottia nimipressuralis]